MIRFKKEKETFKNLRTLIFFCIGNLLPVPVPMDYKLIQISRAHCYRHIYRPCCVNIEILVLFSQTEGENELFENRKEKFKFEKEVVILLSQVEGVKIGIIDNGKD